MFPFFFFNDTATTEIYTLSLHDALPIFRCTFFVKLLERCLQNDGSAFHGEMALCTGNFFPGRPTHRSGDRKSTRLNSSHQIISYAVFCLKKKKNRVIKSTDADYTFCLGR